MSNLLMVPPGLRVFMILLLLSGSLSGCSLIQKLPFPGQPANNAGVSSDNASGASGSTDAANIKLIKSYMNAGNVQAKAGHWSGATEQFQKVLNLDARYAPAHVQIGWAYAEQGQWELAKQHLESAVALSPENGSAHANLAWVYAEKQHWNEAQDEAKKAIDIDPKNAYAHATLAWAYQSTGQDALAISEYEKSLELNPKLDNSRLALGVAYCNRGETLRGKAQLVELKKLKSAKIAILQARLAKGCFVKK